jgi:hypothetical protein
VRITPPLPLPARPCCARRLELERRRSAALEELLSQALRQLSLADDG